MSDSIESHQKEVRRFPPSPEFSAKALVQSHAEYTSMYELSLDEPEAFWRENEGPRLPHAVDDVPEWNLPHAKWFVGATLNVTRELPRSPPHDERAHQRRHRVGGRARRRAHAHVLRAPPRGRAPRRARSPISASKPGDRVAIYMGMVPEAAIAMLACARIGATHSVIFGGFAPTRSAIASTTAGRRCSSRRTAPGAAATSSRSRRWPTTRSSRRRPSRRSSSPRASATSARPSQMKEGRDVWWDDLLERKPSDEALALAKSPPAFDAEHPLFILYTSGSTGKPKGVLHTTAGYLAGAHVTTKYVFDLRDGDLYWCTADVGWVTGHSYIVYGPLSVRRDLPDVRGRAELPRLGPLLAASSRSTASRSSTRRPRPSARSSARATSGPTKHDLSSLRLLGTRRRADQPRGVDLVPPRHRRRPLPHRRHVVADRDRLASC